MADERQQLGADGERAAERFLRARGYTIVERNFRCPLGEVDLIALDRRTVVFVEVKTRRRPGSGSPFDAVDPRKQRQIVRTAKYYLGARRLQDRDVRFDVVGVWADGDGFGCELMQDAFEADDSSGSW
jgi:putative endonuclease